MSDLILIILATVLVNNFVLVKFLGLCPLLGASTKFETTLGMSLATTFVLTLASACSYLIDTWLLMPFGLEYLRLLSFILVIAGSVQFTEMFVRYSSPILHQILGIYLPLITTNCAVLGVALFAGLRERLEVGDVPAPFKGAAIALVTAGLMSMAFIGFSGVIRN
jgi:electron transport complex protein RnfA